MDQLRDAVLCPKHVNALGSGCEGALARVWWATGWNSRLICGKPAFRLERARAMQRARQLDQLVRQDARFLADTRW